MLILTMPTTPAMASSRFGLVSNVSTFQSPLTGQTQTLERPGARWQADYTLPPMKRAEATLWQAFLLQLRGGAGRFYGHDPDAKNPRGTALASLSATRNDLRNSTGLGAALGVIGAGGSAPTNWSFSSASGLTRELLGSGTESGFTYLEVRFSGTPTANFASLNFESSTQIEASEGDVWTGSFYYRLSGGSTTNINAVNQRLEQLSATGTALQANYSALSPVDSTWRRATTTRTMNDTTPDTARIRTALHFSLTIGQPIDITLRLAHPQLEKQSAASFYIPTSGTARQRGSGARINGDGQTGTALLTWNWQPSQAELLKAGDYIAFDTATGRALHMLTANANSDSEGRATLLIEPPLRTPPADNTPLTTSSASAIMGLIESSVNWQTDAAGTYRLSFSAEERF